MGCELFLLVYVDGHLPVTRLENKHRMVSRLFLFSNNFYMKLRLLLILSLLSALSAYADEARVVIRQKSGGETVLQLDTNPVITFSGEDMVVTTSLTSISFPLADVDSYTASDGTTGIRPVVSAPRFADGRIIFSGLAAGSVVSVYTPDGRLISRQRADGSGRADISLASLPKGIYVVRAQDNSIKITNK